MALLGLSAKGVKAQNVVVAGGTYTMNAEEAAALITKMNPKYAIPTHYGDIVGEKTDGKRFAANVKSDTEIVYKI